MPDRLFLEALEIGSTWVSPARTIDASDILSFAAMTGDFDPLHVASEHASESPFGKPVAHGLLCLSIMAGLSSNFPKVRTLALVKVDAWHFLRPVYIGDEVHVVTRVESIAPHGRRSGEVVWFRELINQRGECVQSGRLTTLVSSQGFQPRARRQRSIAAFESAVADG